MDVLQQDSKKGDHRVRVARKRREAMRARLLEAVLAVYPGDNVDGRAGIDDVIRHADVARSTFYRFFDSLDQAVAELGLQLADETAVSNAVIYEGIEDPVLRSTTAFLLYIHRAWIDNRWGTFVAHMGFPQPDHILMRGITANFLSGMECGAFVVDNVDAAINLVVDVLLGGIRHVAEQGGDDRYIAALCSMVLIASGVSRQEAERQVGVATRILEAEGPKLPWWH